MVVRSTPFGILAVGSVLGALAAVLVLTLALRQPWMGLTLGVEAGTGAVVVRSVSPGGPSRDVPAGLELTAIGGQPVQAEDLIQEPDVAETFAQMQRFFDRQTLLARALAVPPVRLETTDAARPVFDILTEPRRPLSSLPLLFWVQLGAGLTSLIVGSWVLGLKPRAPSARLLAIAGFGVLLSSFPAALYSSRELALPGGLFRVLSSLNQAGALTFGAAMLTLMLVYPVRLVRPALLWSIPVIVLAIWVLETARIGFAGPPTARHLPLSTLMAGILVGWGLQYRRSAGDPAARAAIRWFGLSLTICAGTFVLTVIVPPLFKVRPVMSQGYAFVLFALLFLGVAAGVARYRLFDLDRWTLRIFTYLGVAFVLSMLDAMLIFAVSMDRPAAFATSLIAVALIYFPIRDWLTRRLTAAPDQRRHAVFSRVVDVALCGAGERDGRWREVLAEAFQPLRIEVDTGAPVPAPGIAEDGAVLRVPGGYGIRPLRLTYARSGRSLFTPADREFAADILGMLAHAVASRTAFNSGVEDERARIARDMHDNLGGQLLAALHSRTQERKDTLIRESISDLREIVNNAARGGRPLGEFLSDIKGESLDRLASVGIRLNWVNDLEDEERTISPGTGLALRSILREIVSNAIRHSGATTLSITVRTRGAEAFLDARDDGAGPPEATPETGEAGHGLSNIRARLMALGGSMELEDAAPGFRIRAQFDLFGDRRS